MPAPLLAAIIPAVLELGRDLIRRTIPDKQAQNEAIERLERLSQEGELAELTARTSAIVAEAQSGDKWTSRARPTFMYVFYGLLVALIIIAPFVGIFQPEGMQTFYANVKLGFDAIPEAMWWTFTAGFLGYATNRTVEKVKGVAK